MKKFIATMLLAVVALLPLTANARVSRNVEDLPVAAQTFLKKHFSKKVSHIKIDSKFLGSDSYDVILEDGAEIEFDNSGNWKEVDCGRKKVPDSIVPESIRKYVKDNLKKQPIVKISVKSDKYEVELLNGAELIFDKTGKFLRYD